MAFSYTPGGQTSRDRIRARLGDTDAFAPPELRLEDEELDDLLATEGGLLRAAAAAAEILAPGLGLDCPLAHGPGLGWASRAAAGGPQVFYA